MQFADFHNDVLTSDNFSSLPKDYYENKIVTAIFRGKRSFNEVFHLVKKSPYIAFEDVGYDDVDEKALINLNPVYVGLTWNGENCYGYGCDYNYGLKQKGIDLVKKLSKNKIAVDTAHISKMGFMDIIDNADKVVNSHTCLSSVYRHKRNLENWQVKLIIEKGGLVAITCCGYFMTNVKPCKIEGFIRNILYFSEKFGVDNLAIGTDFYGTDFFPEGIVEKYNCFDFVALTLEKEGMTKEEIKKVFYTNLAQYLSKWKYI